MRSRFVSLCMIMMLVVPWSALANAQEGVSSEQLQFVQGGMSTTEVIGTTVGGIKGIAGGIAGSVYAIIIAGGGSSGPCIMAGLAKIGVVVGGGALAGVALCGAAVAATTVGGAYGGYKITRWLTTKD